MPFALFFGRKLRSVSYLSWSALSAGMSPWNIHAVRSKRLLTNFGKSLHRSIILSHSSVLNCLPARLAEIRAFLSLSGSRRRGNWHYYSSIAGSADWRSTMPLHPGACGWLKSIRITYYVLGFCYVIVAALATLVWRGCHAGLPVPSGIIAVSTALRLLWIVGSSVSQAATASTILLMQSDNFVVDNAVRHKRRVTYKRWIRWSRFGTLVTVMQVVGTMYITIVLLKKIGHGHISSLCEDNHPDGWKNILVPFLGIVTVLSTTAQCCAGSNVLKWRSFYATHDGAWKAHYSEMFDHGIREVLCCLGRAKYLSVLEEDEVHSVAGLLGELVAYRASGAGHLEFLAGIALLQSQGQTALSLEQYPEASQDIIREAVLLHPFAEAAYTGPLLDFGRNPVTFPCIWIYRQGVLTPWSRNRRPILQGDNWWRGHAAAYLKFVNLQSSALRKGRVQQAGREAAYFVVVAHHLKCVIIAVRGTESPEDLLTDGLCRECELLEADLEGLLKSSIIDNNLKLHVASSFPHYGHSGIVEAARELCIQLDGSAGSVNTVLNPSINGSQSDMNHQEKGFLSSLLGPGGECHGYALRFVGHSLGGAIGAVAGIMLHTRFPNLHVYGYGVLPCVDASVAEACSSFVTSIIYNNEFSSRLSVTSVLRLRAAALEALAADTSTDSAILAKLARRFLRANKCLSSDTSAEAPVSTSKLHDSSPRNRKRKKRRRHLKYTLKGGIFVCIHATSCVINMHKSSSTRRLKNTVSHKTHKSFKDDTQNVDPVQIEVSSACPKIHDNVTNSDKQTSTLPAGAESKENESYNVSTVLVEDSDTDNHNDEQDDLHEESFTITELPFESTAGNSTSTDVGITNSEPVELFVPGLVIHIVPEIKKPWPSWKTWKWFRHDDVPHRAVFRHRESFKDMVVDPSMFLDHMPWRCHYAMKKVLETWDSKGHMNQDISDSCHCV